MRTFGTHIPKGNPKVNFPSLFKGDFNSSGDNPSTNPIDTDFLEGRREFSSVTREGELSIGSELPGTTRVADNASSLVKEVLSK